VEFLSEDPEKREPHQVCSLSAALAAEIFVENWDIDCENYEPSSETVRVKPADGGEWQTFEVRGGLIPQYYAREVKEDVKEKR